MSNHSNNNYPKLHNAMWPGLVGKGSPGAEPFISLGTMNPIVLVLVLVLETKRADRGRGDGTE